MPEKRVVVWVQHFADRPFLMLQWHDPVTGKRKSKSSETCNPLEAEQKRADLEYELNHGLHQEASGISWGHFRELYETEYVAVKRPNTRENYAAAFDHFEKHCGSPKLKDITARTVSAFAAGMRKAGLAAATVQVRMQLLKASLGWAVRQGLLPKLPHFESVFVPRRRPQPVPAESFEKLLEKTADVQLKAFLLCGWLAGLRLEEAFLLEREPTDRAPWVDFVKSRIWLPADAVKGREDQWVPLDPELRAMLEALPHRGKKVFRFTDGRGGRCEGRLIGVSAVGERIIRLARTAGVKITMRTLRRGFGCRYAGKVPAQVLQKLMRHASITTTMNYYANVDEAAEAAVLGLSRNSTRNSEPSARPATETIFHENANQDTDF
jgi:integrase